MDKVKRLMDAGATLSEAVQIALGKRHLGDVARDQQVSRQNLTSAINGGRAPTAGEIAALVAELGGDEAEWRRLIAEAAHRRVLART